MKFSLSILCGALLLETSAFAASATLDVTAPQVIVKYQPLAPGGCSGNTTFQASPAAGAATPSRTIDPKLWDVKGKGLPLERGAWTITVADEPCVAAIMHGDQITLVTGAPGTQLKQDVQVSNRTVGIAAAAPASGVIALAWIGA